MKQTKAAYIINHGLAPYFRGILYEHIGVSDVVVVSFDESHNDISKSCEMVLVVRYWSSTENCVKTRYLDSTFMGHARENDLLVNFNQMTAKLDKSKIYHVSMDGPSVNHNFLRSLKRDWEKALIHKLIDIGTCNLHIIYGAFKTGAEKSEWNIHKILKGAFQIFHETAARRDDYTLVTSSETFPMFFFGYQMGGKPRAWSWWSQQKPKSKQPCTVRNKCSVVLYNHDMLYFQCFDIL